MIRKRLQNLIPTIPHMSFNFIIPMRGVQGLSLLELLVVIAITGTLMVGVSQLTTLTVSQNDTVLQKIKVETGIYELSFYLRHVLSQGVNVEYVNQAGFTLNSKTSKASGTFPPNIGKLREYDFASTFVAANNDSSADTIAYFLRETWNSMAPHIDSTTNVPYTSGATRFKKTGIFFQKATTKTFGVVYIDLGENTTLAPRASSLRFENVVDFKVFEPEVFGYNLGDPDQVVPDMTGTNATFIEYHPLASVAFKIVVREYSDPGSAIKDYKWCPPTFMLTEATCKTNNHYTDVERVIRVVFRNNVIGHSNVQSTATDVGRFPQPVSITNTVNRIVPMDRRPFEMIYFYKTNYQSGALN